MSKRVETFLTFLRYEKEEEGFACRFVSVSAVSTATGS